MGRSKIFIITGTVMASDQFLRTIYIGIKSAGVYIPDQRKVVPGIIP